MGAVHPSLPPRLVEGLRRAFGLDILVETGTYLGDGAAWGAERFAKVVTIEADDRLHRHAAARLAALPNVVALHGDSGALLRDVVADLDGPALFWLDAHYSGEGTAGIAAECPLIAEIAAIDSGPRAHLVLIDDARMFMAPPPPPHRVEEWPDLKTVLDALLRRDPGALVTIIDDVIVRVPAAGRATFTALLRGEGSENGPPNGRSTGDPAQATLAELEAKGVWHPGTPLRLHLGCGEQLFEGYVNVDYPPSRHNVMAVRPDIEADLTTMALPRGSVDEIRLHHVFEHFNRVVALGLLIRWRGWLKEGGLLVIETPDFVGTARAALDADDPVRRMAFIRHLEGDQSAAWAYHVGQYYPERLARTLHALGFAEIGIETATTEAWHRVGLGNVTARAVKRGERSRDDLVAAAEALLWESTVTDAERPTWEVWRRQLHDFLDGADGPEAPVAHAVSFGPDLPPFDRLIRRLRGLADDPTPIHEIQGFNAAARDAWVAARAAEVPAGARVLDVGAGTCPYRPLFTHARYETHDFTGYEGYQDPAREGLYGAIDHVSDITALPLPAAAFDVVLCTEVLEHVPEPIAAVGEMARVLRPGGSMLLTAPLGSGLHQEPYHFYGGYTPHWYRMVAERFGLDVAEITPNGGTFRHIAQECARVSWWMGRHQHLHGDLAPAIGHLFGDLLPRFLTALDDQVFDPQFTVGYHVVLRKR